MPQNRASSAAAQGLWSALQPIFRYSTQSNQQLAAPKGRENRENSRELVKSG